MSDVNAAQGKSPGEQKEIIWEVVSQAAGLLPAQIMAGRLQSEGIPARAWQEGAGRATGLVVGLLGTGHVEVPREYVEQAQQILAEDVDPNEYWDEEE